MPKIIDWEDEEHEYVGYSDDGGGYGRSGNGGALSEDEDEDTDQQKVTGLVFARFLQEGLKYNESAGDFVCGQLKKRGLWDSTISSGKVQWWPEWANKGFDGWPPACLPKKVRVAEAETVVAAAVGSAHPGMHPGMGPSMHPGMYPGMHPSGGYGMHPCGYSGLAATRLTAAAAAATVCTPAWGCRALPTTPCPRLSRRRSRLNPSSTTTKRTQRSRGSSASLIKD